MKKEIKIEKWITPEEVKGKEDNGLGGLGGFFHAGMRWKDYKNRFQKKVYSMLEELRKSIIKNNIRCTGQQMQEDGLSVVPLWSNGKVDTYTWRAWGDLMAAVWSEKDKKDYSYMDFYM